MPYEPATDLELARVKKWFLKNFPMPGWKVTLEFADAEDIRDLTGTEHRDGTVVFGCAAWDAISRKAHAYVAEPALHIENKESPLETCFHELGHVFWESETPPDGTTIDRERKLNTWAKVLARLYRMDLEEAANG